MKSHTFSPDNSSGQVLRDWWLKLQEDRGTRAELRRARSANDVALIPATIDLIIRLQGSTVARHSRWRHRIPLIAGLAAHLKADEEVVLQAQHILGLPERMAERVSKDKHRPRVSELRFRRLLRLERDELYHPMIRLLALMDGRANLYELADALFWWGPSVKKEWAYAYFPKLPQSTTKSS